MPSITAGPQPRVSEAVVEIKQGLLQGLKAGRLSVFRGIPYGCAERFGPPKPVPPWKGVRLAIEPGPICPQLPSRLENVMGTPKEKRAMSEECQVLSIYSPDCAAKKPVMVWIHGGAYVTGGGEKSWYDASRLADEGDVVTVAVTYRLGGFGYLYTDEYGVSNGGLQDQIAALRWIRENIARFGGDPDNITVFGQSAGGHSIASVLATVEAPLFRRAIIQSAPLSSVMTEEVGKSIGREFRTALGKSPLTASVEEMLAAQRAVLSGSKLGMTFMPIGVDPQKPVIVNESRIDILAGWARDDAAPFVALRLGQNDLGNLLDNPMTKDMTRGIFGTPTAEWAEAMRGGGHRVSLYEINWRPRGSPYGACHCIELPLLLGSPSDWGRAPMLGDVQDRDLQRFGTECRAAWSGFARSAAVPRQTDWLQLVA